ncbi:hypothetical protein AVEN_46652-1 [Araneus ventricosus]|uniref:Pre-C2HC domain-containing protein n=1 Tax=Araneus ventricosus TaxID=182803 RepID=A0A4Y2K816_ARAVE|nr:hypothetical protein AVEN_46652-1 [Araneus ventricosus]
MEEGGRSRSSLSSNTSTQRTISADSGSSRRKSGLAWDESPRDFTATWVNDSTFNERTEIEICQEITAQENAIDDAQRRAQEANKFIKHYPNEDLYLHGKKTQLKNHLERIAKAEDTLKQIGPCPIPTCSRHHGIANDTEMVDPGQYSKLPLPKSPPTSNNSPKAPFKYVSPKKVARPQLGKTKSPVETSNRFQNLMDTTENDIPSDTEIKISIPDINLKISNDYNLTIQEIVRNFPETTCKYNRGYIRISPHTHEDREKIIESLNKSEKEYVLSEAPENRPLKIVIKNLPPDHDKDLISHELESNNFKIIRINQLRNFRLKTLLPIFLVELAKTPNVNNILKLEKINNFNVKIEHYRKKQRATMCYNCSDFFHCARNCKCKPRCIKCNGSHETRMCNITTKIENPVCINCKEIGHLASWKGCPKYPVIKNNTPPTYAQKLKSNLQKNNSVPTPSLNNPTPQIDTVTYEEFVKNMNALRIINDAFNKFPNLIEISEKIKLAKTDMEIVGLLLKIFKN